jgi:cytochrome P450
MGFDFAIVNAPYASRWRRMRKALHPHVAPSALPAYASTQLRGVRYMLNQLVSQPNSFREHNRASVLAAPITVILF